MTASRPMLMDFAWGFRCVLALRHAFKRPSGGCHLVIVFGQYVVADRH